VEWDNDTVVLRYQLSNHLIKNVIEILDDPKRDNSEIKPGLYNLLPPPPEQRLGKDRTPKPGRPKRNPHKRHKHHRVTGRMSATKA
jgi:hypothetical protein